MVAAFESPQNSPPERLRGSQKPTTGLSFFACSFRPETSMDTPAVRGATMGALNESDEEQRASCGQQH